MQQSEYPEWEMQSRLLNKEEVADPTIVLDEVFDYAHLPEWRSLLWEWLKITVSGAYNTESADYDRYSILFTYEKLQKLIEAAHLIYVQQEASKELEKEEERHIF
ncbi:MAG: hypothetical protein U1C70_11105 [Sediminibacterium sp.]|jgi:hypothetical protein|uniref:hypothetical protein n=1 Tax=Sediminibacterium sp. TaxID=1917865 RepID=UPI002AB90893|nr:hypothetical protein [Sediminibacterium sp.]MDZ4072362.1 hypothetical protein [Sediminibacterium sp.]